MTRGKKILLIGDQRVPFIQDYRKALEMIGEVRCVDPVSLKVGIVGAIKRQVRVFSGLLWSDIAVAFFLDFDAAISAIIGNMLGKRSFAVLAGYEVHRYKGKATGVGSISPKLASYFSTRVIAVHEDLRARAIKEFGADPSRICVLNIALDPNGFDASGTDRQYIITVGLASDEARILVKGHDLFKRLAENNPQLRFIMVGISGEAMSILSRDKPENLTILGPKSRPEIIALFNQSKVYCQLSRREGFPVAICEAMLCGCVPLGSDIPGIITIIGQAGRISRTGDVDSASQELKLALVMDGNESRKRILDNFTIEDFNKKLKMIILEEEHECETDG